ncbi:MAG: radical SAM family heme chaperone HemW [Atopobiaceae bacterium]|nr:radical SAM family heme chaperone HemW [Atopobiaceae bacterium]
MISVGALYIHVPFCRRKCLYCDFASMPTSADDARLRLYMEQLGHQLEESCNAGLLRECRTAYVGGGTPTLLGADLLGELIARVRRTCPQVRELTFEANPDSLSDEVLAAALGAGATRISIGVQSFCDEELEALGRLHTAEVARRRVRNAVRSGLSVSVDLMCAVPCQTDDSWQRTLDEAVGLGVGHVSVYPLTIEDGTEFGAQYGRHVPAWNDEDVQADRMEQAQRTLIASGFERYEVASYARLGMDCKHNQAYWTGVPYLGLGTGAAGMLLPGQCDAVRKVLTWFPNIDATAARVRYETQSREVEFLGAREAWAEDLMLGMRMSRGVDAQLVPANVLENLEQRGLVRREGGRMVPTHDGWLLGNELYGALWDLA